MSTIALPPWSRAEIVLALDLAVAREGEHVGVGDPEIVRLSTLLRSATPIPDARFRNPHGVARKVWTFATLLAGRAARSTSPIERSVWDEFVGDRKAFDHSVRLAGAQLAPMQVETPTRGPSPAVGVFEVERRDQPSVVYAAMLDGARLKSGDVLLKVGMTNDVSQRERQLNFGLPRLLQIRWKIVRTWAFATANAAHQIEQAILRSEARRGRSAGGEFVRLNPSGLALFLDRCDATAANPAHRRWTSNPRPRRKGAGRLHRTVLA